MQIRILKPGLLSTIQDLGRQQYLSQAVPVSGAMDTLSARLANKLVGNADKAAVIEFTYADAAFIAETDILIAYAGDGAVLVVDEQKIPKDRPVFTPTGATVKLVATSSGSRTYLAIAGGWNVPDVLGSKSTFLTAGFGGLDGRALKKGDVLKSTENNTILSRKILEKLSVKTTNYPTWGITLREFLPTDNKVIRIVKANEFSWFDDRSVADFLSASYTIGIQSNRMGYQLEGPTIEHKKTDELLSTAVTPGTIQVTGNGTMIILMADCQTTGGYPRIAQVAAVDLSHCAQLKPGDTINFKEISKLEAEKLYIEREQHLRQLTAAIAIKYL